MTGRLPDFLVIGAMKGGTTSLYRLLERHPSIWFPEVKEPDFFVEEHGWTNGVDWYRSLFAGAGEDQLVGEASTSYTKHPRFDGVPERIAALLPEVRLVYVLRHPVDRMRSHYLHNVLAGREHRPIDAALLEDEHYAWSSRYAWQLGRFLDHVEADRILLLRTEDLAADRDGTLTRAFKFLGVADRVIAGEAAYNETAARRHRSRTGQLLDAVPGVGALRRVTPAPLRALSRRVTTAGLGPERSALAPATTAALRERLRDDVERLVQLTGDERFAWDLLEERAAAP